MCVDAFVCMYVWNRSRSQQDVAPTNVYIYLCSACAFLFACMYMSLCMYACMHACMCMCMCVYVYVYVYVCVYMYVYVYVYVSNTFLLVPVLLT